MWLVEDKCWGRMTGMWGRFGSDREVDELRWWNNKMQDCSVLRGIWQQGLPPQDAPS